MSANWPAPYVSTPIKASVTIPGSKSITNRAYVLAALAEGPSQLTGMLRSRDTDLMSQALRSLGVEIVDKPDGTTNVTPGPLRGGMVNCGLAGTVMRFVPAVAALATGEVLFDGDLYARKRPMSTILDALRTLGADIDGDRLPFKVRGQGSVRGGEVTIDASESSQFVSGLLLAGARFEHGISIYHSGNKVPSTPHIQMTLDMIAESGGKVSVGGDGRRWRVEPGPLRAVNRIIEPDLSNATPFLAAAAVTGGSISIPHWPSNTTQPGDQIRPILEQMGAQVVLDGSTLTVSGPEQLCGVDLDMSDIGELAPTIAALAALASTPSRLRGIAHLRGHETDRLAALSTEINALGGSCQEHADGLAITPAPLHGGVWGAYEDHRMATAGAIIGLKVPGVEVDDIATTAKTLPGFDQMWADMING